jgi:hypothetical protein
VTWDVAHIRLSSGGTQNPTSGIASRITSERNLNVLGLLGPFAFEASQYETAVLAAAAFDAPDDRCAL